MTVAVRAKLPKGDTNGLAGLEIALADNPDRIHVVVGLLRADTIESRPHNAEDRQLVKTVLLHLEVVTGLEADDIDATLHKIYEQRTGKVALPFEDDDE